MADDDDFPDDWLEEGGEDAAGDAAAQAVAEVEAEDTTEAQAEDDPDADAGAEGEPEADAEIELDANAEETIEDEAEAETAVDTGMVDVEIDLSGEAVAEAEGEGEEDADEDLADMEAAVLASFASGCGAQVEDVDVTPKARVGPANAAAAGGKAVMKGNGRATPGFVQPTQKAAGKVLGKGKGAAPGKGAGKPNAQSQFQAQGKAWPSGKATPGKATPGKGTPGKSTPGKSTSGKASPSAASPSAGKGTHGKGKSNTQGKGSADVGGAGSGTTTGKGGGKSAEAALGQKVLALNRSGHWLKGRGIDVKALASLRSLEAKKAVAILDKLEKIAASIKNPSAHILLRVKEALAGGGDDENVETVETVVVEEEEDTPEPTPSTGKGAKRPAPVDATEAPPAKRAAPRPIAVQLIPSVTKQLELVKAQGMEISSAALQELSKAEERDSLVVLKALAMRGHVEKPSSFVLASLRKRAEMRGGVPKPVGTAETAVAKAAVAKTPGPKPAVAKGPIAKTPSPAAKAPIAKTPGAKAPVAKTPAAKTSVVKAVGKAPIAKRPGAVPAKKTAVPGKNLMPMMRSGLEVMHMAMQEKVKTLNKLGIWEIDYPIDEAALTALLRISADRGLEILDDVEEKGLALSDPSDFVMEKVAEEEEQQAML